MVKMRIDLATRQKWHERAVIAGCLYEAMALVSKDRLPTITMLVRRVGASHTGRLLVWAWCGYISWHFLEPIVAEVVAQ